MIGFTLFQGLLKVINFMLSQSGLLHSKNILNNAVFHFRIRIYLTVLPSWCGCTIWFYAIALYGSYTFHFHNVSGVYMWCVDLFHS